MEPPPQIEDLRDPILRLDQMIHRQDIEIAQRAEVIHLLRCLCAFQLLIIISLLVMAFLK